MSNDRPTGPGGSTEPSPHGLRGRDARALSDVIGFVLTFAIIVSAVAIVSTVGVSSLNDIQQSEQLRNAERAFEIVAGNLHDIEEGRASRRSSELDLHGGGIETVNDSEFTVTVTGTGVSETIATRTLRYSRGDTEILYQNGATFRGGRGGNVIQTTPELVCTEHTAVVSIVKLVTVDQRRLGSGTVRITGQERRTRLIYPRNRTGPDSPTSSSQVVLGVDSPNEEAWAGYFRKDSNRWDKVGPDQYGCTGVDRIYVRQTVIELSFTR